MKSRHAVVAAIISGLCFSLLVFPPRPVYAQENEGAVFLLDEARTEFSPPETTVTNIHQVIRVTGEKGKKFAEVKIPFNDERQRVQIHTARTLTPAGATIDVAPRNMKIVTPAELTRFAPLFPGIKPTR